MTDYTDENNKKKTTHQEHGIETSSDKQSKMHVYKKYLAIGAILLIGLFSLRIVWYYRENTCIFGSWISKLDNNKYHYYTLDNGVKVMLVSNPSVEMAACSVSMGVGYFNDPDNVPGLAHLCEHMLTRGSKKYPDSIYYANLIAKHGGNSNAFTAPEHTFYYASIHRNHLSELIDVMSAYFIDPLFNKDYVEKEVTVVHSEFLNSTGVKGSGVFPIFSNFVKDNAKEKKFGCGNLQTLQIPDIHKYVTDFYKNNYSSDKCVVVICGKESIDELKEMAKVFKNVSRLKTKNNVIKPDIDIYDSKYKGRYIKSPSSMGQNFIVIKTTVKSQKRNVKTNANAFFTKLLTGKGKGSLINELKNRNLGYNVTFITYDFDEYTSISVELSLNVETDKDAALQLFYDKLKEIKHKITKDEYNRMATIEKTKIMYSEIKTPLNLVIDLSNNLHTMSPDCAMNSMCVMDKYDQVLLNDYLDRLLDWENWTVINFTYDINSDRIEKAAVGYVIYSYEITDEKLSIKDTKVDKLPTDDIKTNDLLTNITLLKLDDKKGFKKWQDKYYRVHNNLSFLFDDQLKIPKGVINVIFKAKEQQNIHKIYLYGLLLVDTFIEEHADELESAGVSICVQIVENTLKFTFEGFNNHLDKYTLLFFKHSKINKNFKFPLQNAVKCSLDIILCDVPCAKAASVFKQSALNLMSDELAYEEIKNLDLDSFGDINLLKDLQVNVIAVGNLDYNKIKNMADEISKIYPVKDMKRSIINPPPTIKFTTTVPNANVFYRIYKIPKDKMIYVKTITSKINMMFIDELRNKEQIGYVLITTTKNLCDELFLFFIVQSPLDVDFLKNRVVRFIDQINDKIRNMSENDLNDIKNAMYEHLTMKYLNLSTLTEFAMLIHRTDRFNFNKLEKYAEQVKKITIVDLLIDYSQFKKYDVATTTN